MVLGKLDSHMPKNKTGPFYTIPKHYSKWINDWSVKPEIIKFLKENASSKLLDVGFDV